MPLPLRATSSPARTASSGIRARSMGRRGSPGSRPAASSGPSSPSSPASNMVRLPNGQVLVRDSILLTVWGWPLVRESSRLRTCQRRAPPLTPTSPPRVPAASRSARTATCGQRAVLRASCGSAGSTRVAGGLDYRHRPKQAPDYSEWIHLCVPIWTNVSGTAEADVCRSGTTGGRGNPLGPETRRKSAGVYRAGQSQQERRLVDAEESGQAERTATMR